MEYWSTDITLINENRDEKPSAKNSAEKTNSVYKGKRSFYNHKDFELEGSDFKPTQDMIEKEMVSVRKAAENVLAESEKLLETEFNSIDFDQIEHFENVPIYNQQGGFDRRDPFTNLPTKQLALPKISDKFEKRIKASERRIQYMKTSFFEPIETNLAAGDCLQVTHLPLIIERMDDEKVGHGLYLHYPNGIHGYLPNEYKINYEMLYKMMKQLLVKDAQPQLLYYALYRVFPNYGTQQEYSEMFSKLVEQFGGGTGILSLERWKAGKKEGELFDVGNPSDSKNYIVKKMDVKSADWSKPCSENCFKSLNSGNLNSHMREIMRNHENEQFLLYIKKSVSKKNAYFFNALLNNKEDTIRTFCETANKFSQKDCAESFKTLLGYCIPKDRLRDPMIDKFTKRDQRFRTAMKKTHDQLALKEEMLDLIVSINPCSHLGPCGPDVAECSCDLMCTIQCDCDVNCARKFVGCQCKAGQCKTSNCPCFKIGFECNELTCGTCAQDDATCKNRAITQGITKKVSVRKSKIAKAGSGLFMEETAEKGDYLGEYTGEIISDSELERRGAVDRFSISYIFTLGSTKGLDSSRAGNLFRYANNDQENPNCHVFYRNVDGKPRIGFWASQKLHVGEELFFDYCYDEEHIRTFFETHPEDRVEKIAEWPVATVEKKEKKSMKRKARDSSASSPSEVMDVKTRSGRVTKRRSYVDSE